jgi:hypothetical protein
MPNDTALSILFDTLRCMGISTQGLSEDTHLTKDLNLDSLEFAELAAALSRCCGLKTGALNVHELLALTIGDVTHRLVALSTPTVEELRI